MTESVPRVGTVLPGLSLRATSGGRLAIDRAPNGSRYLVLYGYPRISSPDVQMPESWATIPGAVGCTAESCRFRDLDRDFAALDAEIIGVSTQSREEQQAAVARLGLPFPLVSDEDLEFTRALRLPTFTVAGSTMLRRQTLVVEEGRIAQVFHPIEDPGSHPHDVLQWIRGR
ncbi:MULTISPECIES: peroxiredoxin [unclassified Micromonospora]|uniref:peroxiredoxin n=1 Tax=unclassified Micromonospora TaxID=2617518 RepID=UPI00188E6D91|nr:MULTISPECIES: peroxiredoxin [unclassified Micromonospora]MBF5028522.1 peroxiredoxin [Micromonospora sp. ANENR4]MCZ7473005.1 peroxiredoxin [Micromonospora sp. WMMC273]WBC03686.1 peroxiredoxin [Micromonospora sp. WMMA1976]